jgi:hypothetical protein
MVVTPGNLADYPSPGAREAPEISSRPFWQGAEINNLIEQAEDLSPAEAAELRKYIGILQSAGVPLSSFDRQQIIAYARAEARIRELQHEQEEDRDFAQTHYEGQKAALTSEQRRTYDFFSDRSTPWGQAFNEMNALEREEFARTATALMADPNSVPGRQMAAVMNNPAARTVATAQNIEAINEAEEIKRSHPDAASTIDNIIQRGGGVISPDVRDALRQYRETGERSHLERAEREERLNRGRVAEGLIGATENPQARRILENRFAGKSPEEIARDLENFNHNDPEVQRAREAYQRVGGRLDDPRLTDRQRELIAMNNLRNQTAVAAPLAALGEYHQRMVREVGRERADQMVREMTEGKSTTQIVDAMANNGIIRNDDATKRSVALGLSGLNSSEKFLQAARIYEDGELNAQEIAELRRIQGADKFSEYERNTGLDTALKTDYTTLKTRIDEFGGFKIKTAVASSTTVITDQSADIRTAASGNSEVSATTTNPAPKNPMEIALAQAQKEGVQNSSITAAQEASPEAVSVQDTPAKARMASKTSSMSHAG